MQSLVTSSWSSAQIAEDYLRFFAERGHTRVLGSPLVVPGTTTTFVIAGMQPLLPYLRGAMPAPAPRLVGMQACLRTVDIARVGGNARTLTSFYMLGNWSVGDYGRREAIALALALLDHFGLERPALWVTTFGGDSERGLAADHEAVAEWRAAGVPPERIVPLGYDDNFWTTGGPGPCGPCTELYVDRGEALGCGQPECRPGCACDRFLEVWNLVFIELDEHPDGTYERLPLRSVDTGMGLERFAAVAQGVRTVHEIDLFAPAVRRLAELAPVPADEGEREQHARRIIVDHARAALLAVLAGVTPGPDGAGSVLRRLLRRASRQGRLLGLRQSFLAELVPPLLATHAPLLRDTERERSALVAPLLTAEERGFARVLATGLRLLDRVRPDERGSVPGELLFTLHAARGFPPDLAAEVLAERGLAVEWESYERALAEHRAISRVSANKRFRGV
ncbi:MAG: alanine--tRNA ligase-related protein [Ktedonobacterales bacterium]